MKGAKKMNEESLISSAMFIFGLAAVGYAIYINGKMNKICTKLDTTADELLNSADVSVEKAVVKAAVNRVAERETCRIIESASETVINQARSDIQKKVKAAVDDAYSDLREKVTLEINRQVGNIDIGEIRRDVIKKAGERASEKFESDLESVLEKYNRDLKNVSKIYNSIAKSMTDRDDGKAMTFRIA